MNDNESDEDYQDREGPVSDGESVSGSKTEVGGGESDEEESAFKYDYGNLEEWDVLMEEVGLVVTMKKHAKICGCDPDDPNTTHFLQAAGDDDTDSGVEDLDDANEELENEGGNDEEAEAFDDIDEGYEEGDEED